MARTPVTYEFYILGGRFNTPETFAKEAQEIAGRFFGDEVFVVEMTITGTQNQQGGLSASCVARATVAT